MATEHRGTVTIRETEGICVINTSTGRDKGGSLALEDAVKTRSAGESKVSKNGALKRALNRPETSDRDSDGGLLDEYLKFYLASLPFEY